jgi:hypothetical protein
MQKLIVALSAILLTGIAGGFAATGNVAQEARRERAPIIELDEDDATELRLADGVWLQRQPAPRVIESRPGILFQNNQPGTWQIVTGREQMVLLNTATGETFRLVENKEGVHWQPIPRPMDERRSMPEMPRMPNPRGDREMPRMDDLEAKLEAMRKELKGAKGEARERIERSIEELERAMERARDADKRQPAPRDRDDDAANQLRELDEKIGKLKKKHEESDSIKDRAEIEQMIKELRSKAEKLKKER